MQGCLDERTILDVAEGSLEASRQAGVADHLDTCELCRQLVALAAREDRGDEPDDAAPPPTLPSRQWLSQGQTVGRYTILKFLGAGGMGAVYAAYDPQLDRKVALKLLRPGGGAASARERLATLLQREGQALARVSHPNVVAVYDAGTFEDQVFVAMEFVEGENLRAWLAVKPRPWREVLRVLSEAGAGLCAAHEVGLVHRDFKPANVLLDGSPAADRGPSSVSARIGKNCQKSVP